MLRKMLSIFSLLVIPAVVLMIPVDAQSQPADQDEVAHIKAGHQKIEGVVTDLKSGLYTVKTPTGTLTLSENEALRHGHRAPQIGDELVLWVNEGNLVIDAHPKGEAASAHRFISGKLASLDNANSKVTLSTSEGEKSFKLKPESRMFMEIAVGTPVTIEVNESGEVIDLHKDKK
jgi:hypothetical protein